MSDSDLTSSLITQSANSNSDTSPNIHQPKSETNQSNKDSGEDRNLTTGDTTKFGEKTEFPTNIATSDHASKRRDSTSSTTRASELADLEVRLRAALRQFPDFPSPGILFEDILPIFADPSLHGALLRALEYSVEDVCAGTVATTDATAAIATVSASASASALVPSLVRGGTSERLKPDVIVGLEARGFLFGPALALRLGAAFVPVRKKGKLPGRTWSASYVKEYGEDVFEMQRDIIKPGQRVLVVDDIIATGKVFIFIIHCTFTGFWRSTLIVME